MWPESMLLLAGLLFLVAVVNFALMLRAMRDSSHARRVNRRAGSPEGR